MTRRRRANERGQVVILAALMAIVIIGASAIAVDVGVNTFSQRTFQNVTDAAALAGATDLGTQPTAAQQQQAIADALLTIQKNKNFPAGWTGASVATACGSGYCENVTYRNYTFALSTPPRSARAANNATVHDFEVDLSLGVHNAFGTIIGSPTSTIAAHSIAYHSGPPAPYSFTFFARTEAESGNQQETIYGDAFVGNGYAPQSSGMSGLCVYEVAGGTQGHVVFGVVPPTVGSDPTSYGVAPPTCPGKGALTAQAPAPQLASPASCPTPSTPQTDTSTGNVLCVLTPGNPPAVAMPTVTQGVLPCGGTITSATGAGVYGVPPGCAVNLDFSSGNIDCVSLVLGAGSSVLTTNKSGSSYITSYGFATPDSIADADVTTIGATPLPSACPGATIAADKSVIWAPSVPITSTPPVVLTNGSKGGGGKSDTLFIGGIFVPGQEISYTTNQTIQDAGSVYCAWWDVQSGNHPNPTVDFDAGNASYVGEVLRLVE
ncbi:MAG: pilus assembly protein TadG-related protein [Candidatus Dormiibacterota bacterium]